jgi:putative ABC transport system permease protein
MEVSAPRGRARESEQVAAFFQEVLNRIRAVPGVESAAASSNLPLGGGGFYLGRVFLLEGQPEPPAAPDQPAQWNVVSPDYFKALGLGLLRGRYFTEQDRANTTPVIIINETMAQRMFPAGDALGRRIRSWRDENLLREIVGVVRDVRHFGLDDELRGIVYVPHTQDSWRSMALVVRTAGESAGSLGAIRQAIWSVDKDLAIAKVKTMSRTLAESVARPRFSMLLLGVFAAVALLLASVGIYGVMAYAVEQRTREIGVRMALGARGSDVLRMIVGHGMALALVGIAAGLAGAFALTRVMATLLYGVTATDPLTFALVPLLLAAVALLACYLPARRATKVDPMVALRYE